MKWNKKIEMWLKGEYQKYPSKIKDSFFYETSPITHEMNTCYKDKYIVDHDLGKMEQDYSAFRNKIKKSKNKQVVSFWNLSKTSYLVVPMPKRNKNFTTIKDFMDNASKTQQKELWKKVARSAIMMLKKYDKVWISTHGTGVPYLHIRIDTKPKYYKTKQFN